MSKRFLEAVKAGEAEKVREALGAEPQLAQARDEQGVSALLNALYHRRSEVAALLREARGGAAGLDIFEAAAGGERERVAAILKDDPEAAAAYSPDGWTALHLAAFFAQAPVVELLLERGAVVNARSQNLNANMPLHAAVVLSDVATVKLLLGHGAEVNATQAGGFTPLHGAAAAGKAEVVELLLNYQADGAALSDGGRSALEMAEERGHQKAAEMLRRPEDYSPGNLPRR
jgi:ankyrin repeat protein